MPAPAHTPRFTLNDVAAFHELRANDLVLDGYKETAFDALARAATIRRAMANHAALVAALESIKRKARFESTEEETDILEIARAALATLNT